MTESHGPVIFALNKKKKKNGNNLSSLLPFSCVEMGRDQSVSIRTWAQTLTSLSASMAFGVVLIIYLGYPGATLVGVRLHRHNGWWDIRDVQLGARRRLWPTTSHHHQRLPAATIFLSASGGSASYPLACGAFGFSIFYLLIFFFTRPVPHTRPSESIDFFVVVSFETCHYPNSVIPIAI